MDECRPVVVDPNGLTSASVMEVTPNYYATKGSPPDPNGPANYKPATVTVNPENSTWHGLGHVINAGKTQDKVLNFDNLTRSMTTPPLPARKPDETHNKTVTTGSGSVWEQH